jgi:hypothetical protein
VEAVVAAVVAYNGEDITLAYNNDGEDASFPTTVDADDTLVLYYDFDKNVGEANGNIVKADTADGAGDVAYGDDNYVYNVLYVANATEGDPLVLLVVDTAADWNADNAE